MPGGLGRLQRFIEDPCCETFASRGSTSDFNFCPWCGTNFKSPQFIYAVSPQEKLIAKEFMNEWHMEEGYRGYAGFERSERRAMYDLVKDYIECLLEGKEKNPVFIHKVDISNAKKIELTEDHLLDMIAHYGTSNIESYREFAEQVIKNKEQLLRRKV